MKFPGERTGLSPVDETERRSFRTFHRLHKDLLLFGGVLLVQDNAVKDAAKRSCGRARQKGVI